MSRWVAVMLAVLVLGPVVAWAQAPPSGPGNPTNPGDTIANPHPTMPWVGITTPYGQFLRWVWMPPQPVVADDQVLYQPGFWAAQTTAGYYYPARWVLQPTSSGSLGWVLVNGGAVPFAR
jgi:hypothetical protein